MRPWLGGVETLTPVSSGCDDSLAAAPRRARHRRTSTCCSRSRAPARTTRRSPPRCTTPSTRPSTPAPTSSSPSGRSPRAASTKIADLLDLPARRRRPPLGRRLQRRGRSSATRRSRCVHEEPFDASAAVRHVHRASTPEALVAVGGRRRRLRGSTGRSPTASLSGGMIEPERRQHPRPARQPRDHPRSRVASADDFVAGGRGRGSVCTAPTTSSRWTAWLDLSPVRSLHGVRAAVRRPATSTCPASTAPRHRRRPRRHRDAPLGRPRGRHGPGSPRTSTRPPTPRHRHRPRRRCRGQPDVGFAAGSADGPARRRLRVLRERGVPDDRLGSCGCARRSWSPTRRRR